MSERLNEYVKCGVIYVPGRHDDEMIKHIEETYLCGTKSFDFNHTDDDRRKLHNVWTYTYGPYEQGQKILRFYVKLFEWEQLYKWLSQTEIKHFFRNRTREEVTMQYD